MGANVPFGAGRLSIGMSQTGRSATDAVAADRPIRESHFRLFGDLESVIDLNAQVSDRALQLAVTQQQLNHA